MEINTCIKYLDFVSQECERHMRDGEISDEELCQLIIEFQRFQKKCRESVLPSEIRHRIENIKLEYTLGGVERGNWFLLAAFFTLGAWSGLISIRKQAQRKQALQNLKFDTSRLSSFIQLNY